MTIEFIEIAKWVGGSMLAVAAMTVLVGVAYAQFRKGSREESNAVVSAADNVADFWHKQADEYKAMMVVKEEAFQKQISDITERYQKQISELTEKVGVLTGKLGSTTEYADKLEKIFQGRNPEMDAFMSHMVEYAKQSTNTFSEITKALGDIHTMSLSNHTMLDSRKKEVIIEGTLEKQV